MADFFTIWFLKSALASAAGNVIYAGLKAINSKIADLIKNGAPDCEISKAINEAGVDEDVQNFAADIGRKSIFYSDLKHIAKRPQELSQVIAMLFDFSLRICNIEKMDLLLPGSPIGPDSVTFLRCGERKSTQVLADGVEVRLPKLDSGQSAVFIVPEVGESKVEAAWNRYKEKIIRDAKENARPWLYSDHFNSEFPHSRGVQSISAGSVRYEAPLERGAPGGPSPEDAKYRIVTQVGLRDWSGGIKRMVQSLVAVRDFEFLDPKEWAKLQEVADLISNRIRLG